MAHDNNTNREFIPLNIAVLTVSDSRTEASEKVSASRNSSTSTPGSW